MAEKSAIITGAGSGIGRATAIALAQSNYALTLVGRTESDLNETASRCRNALVVPADVTDPIAMDRVVATAMDRFKRIDAVVNNAGYAPIVKIQDITLDQWRQIIDTNLSAAFYLCKLAWPIFQRQGGGVIVNISSESARNPFLGLAAYGAAKAALNLLGHALAQEGSEINIRVHTIAPAAVETKMLRKIVPVNQYPTEKTLDPTDVARLVLQCIDGDLRHTSGEVIYVHKTI